MATVEAEHPTWYALDAAKVTAELGVDPASGLDGTEVTSRQAKYGPNKFADAKPEPRWHVFVRQYRDAMQIVLLVVGLGSICGRSNPNVDESDTRRADDGPQPVDIHPAGGGRGPHAARENRDRGCHRHLPTGHGHCAPGHRHHTAGHCHDAAGHGRCADYHRHSGARHSDGAGRHGHRAAHNGHGHRRLGSAAGDGNHHNDDYEWCDSGRRCGCRSCGRVIGRAGKRHSLGLDRRRDGCSGASFRRSRLVVARAPSFRPASMITA